MKPKESERAKRKRDQQVSERDRIREGLRIAANYAQEHRQQSPVGLVNKAGAALFCGLSVNTIGRATAGGYVKSLIVGGKRMYFVLDLITFLETLRKASEDGKPIRFSSRDGDEPLIPEDQKIRPGRPRKSRPVAVLGADE